MRRPVRAEFSATASSSGFEHHCTPAGPSCTSIFGPAIADGDRIRELDVFLWRHRRAHEQAFDGLAIIVRETRENRLAIAIDDRILIAHRDRKGDADADVGSRFADRLRFVHQRHSPARTGVMHHHRRASGPRRARQRGSRRQIRIDRRPQRGTQDPAFQRHADRAERRRGRPRMIMGIDEGRNDEESAAR